ncbi:hypothetical protein OROMI_033491 [Orobanche minor]
MAASAAQVHALGTTTCFTTGNSRRNNASKTLFFGNKLNNSDLIKLKLRSKAKCNSRRSAPLRVVAEKVVGIDLGTTNSAVAAMEGGKPTI